MQNNSIVSTSSSTNSTNIISQPPTQPVQDDINVKVARLESELRALQKKKFVEINLTNGLITALITALVGSFLYNLQSEKNSLNNEIKILQCKNNTVIDCYNKCNLREININQHKCEKELSST